MIKSKNKIKPIYIYIAIFLIAAVFGISVALFKNLPKIEKIDNGIPQKPIHWHPKLKIIIKGEEQIIPSDIGITIGNNIDNEISGMRMSPIHTHESDGTLHLEINNPWLKPEVLTLGYFFKVWNKKLNSSCIFDYCNSQNGSLAMSVNNKPNYEFDKYVMHDKDEIVIEYT